MTDEFCTTIANQFCQIFKEDKPVKAIPSRIDYDFFNYCSTCELKFSKRVHVVKTAIKKSEPNHGIAPKLSISKDFDPKLLLICNQQDVSVSPSPESMIMIINFK